MYACAGCSHAHRVFILGSGMLLIGVFKSGASHAMGLFARVVVCGLCVRSGRREDCKCRETGGRGDVSDTLKYCVVCGIGQY